MRNSIPIAFSLLLTTLIALPQALPPVWLDFEAPDAFFTSNGDYNESGLVHPDVIVSNTGSASWGLSTDEFESGAQSMYLTIPGCSGCTVDGSTFSRREWRIGTLVNNQTYWMAMKVWYNTAHQNPEFYGRVLSQVKISVGYGFQFAIYEMTGSASADIPIGIRYFERTGPDQGDVLFDSGEISSGVSLARNAWHEIKYQFRNSSTAGDAFIRLWINDTMVLERTNLTVVGYSNGAFQTRVGSYGRYEPYRVEKRFDNIRFGLTEADVDDDSTPPPPPDPPVDDGEFASIAIASNMKRYFHVQAEAVVDADDINGLVMVSKGDPAPLAAADITGPAVAFLTNGVVYARDYGLNRARQTINYTVGTTNILDFYITTETQRYDVWITLPGGSPLLLGRNYAFTNLFDEYSHAGWTTNMTTTVASQTNILRSGTINNLIAGGIQ